MLNQFSIVICLTILFGCRKETSNEIVTIRVYGSFEISVNTQTDSVVVYDHIAYDTIIDNDSCSDFRLSKVKAFKSADICDSLSLLAHSILEDKTQAIEFAEWYTGDRFSIHAKRGSANYYTEVCWVPHWERCTDNTAALNRFLKRNNLIK